MSEMSGSENIPHCTRVAMRLIESSHDPLSSGYVYDSVPPGRAVMERDRHDLSAHVTCQSWVITNTCQAFILILCVIAGVLGIWHIMNQRYVLTFLMFLYISNLSYIHPGNSESSTI